MKFHSTSLAVALLVTTAAPAFAQEQDGGAPAVAIAETSAVATVRETLIPQDELVFALRPYARAPLFEMLLIYPELGALMDDDAAATALIDQPAALWQAHLRGKLEENNARFESALTAKFGDETIAQMSDFIEAREDTLVPVLAAVSTASLTYTNMFALRDNPEVMAIVSEAHAQGGGPLLREHALVTRALMGWLEDRKEEAYAPMQQEIRDIAESYQVALPDVEQLVTEANSRPDLKAVFDAYNITEDEKEILLAAGTDASLDFIIANTPFYAAAFAENEGMRDQIRDRQIARAREAMAVEEETLRIGFVRYLMDSIDTTRTQAVIAFLNSDIGAKYIGTFGEEEARGAVNSLLEAQANASDLEEASTSTVDALEQWGMSLAQRLDLTDSEAVRLEAFLDSPAGADLYMIDSTYGDLASIQNSYSVMRYLPRNTVMLDRDIGNFVAAQSQAETAGN